MRLYLFFIVLLFRLCSPVLSYAQSNLVPNPSFEDTVFCPIYTNQIHACQNWLNFGNSPDYFNSCTPNWGIPNQPFGYQFAHTGQAMAGIALYRKPNSPSGPDYREYFGVELTQPLTVGVKYYFSFFVNFAGEPLTAIACNKMGLRFSTSANDSCCLPLINNWAHFYSDSILSDSVNWLLLSSSFIADSAYSYLSIGNFFNDSNTDTLNITQFPDNSYYYIDDVCVSTDSLFSQTWTSLFQIKLTEISLFPNPTSETITINGLNTPFEYKIIDFQGRILLNSSHNLKITNNQLNISFLSPGTYLMILKTKDQIVSKTIIKL